MSRVMQDTYNKPLLAVNPLEFCESF